jgi:hypothetical protein
VGLEAFLWGKGIVLREGGNVLACPRPGEEWGKSLFECLIVCPALSVCKNLQIIGGAKAAFFFSFF